MNAIGKGAKWLTKRASQFFGSGNYGDEIAEAVGRTMDNVGSVCPRKNSFSGDTLVATADGFVPISEIEVGDKVLAYNELSGETGEYTVTHTISHTDDEIVLLYIDGELIETTAEHPFYTDEDTWIAAAALTVGEEIVTLSGEYGTVEQVQIIPASQPMYNLTVEEAHTFFVGEAGWLVHNQTDSVRRFWFYEITELAQRDPGLARLIDDWRQGLGELDPYDIPAVQNYMVNSNLSPYERGRAGEIVRRFVSPQEYKQVIKNGLTFDPEFGNGIPTTTTNIRPEKQGELSGQKWGYEMPNTTMMSK